MHLSSQTTLYPRPSLLCLCLQVINIGVPSIPMRCRLLYHHHKTRYERRRLRSFSFLQPTNLEWTQSDCIIELLTVVHQIVAVSVLDRVNGTGHWTLARPSFTCGCGTVYFLRRKGVEQIRTPRKKIFIFQSGLAIILGAFRSLHTHGVQEQTSHVRTFLLTTPTNISIEILVNTSFVALTFLALSLDHEYPFFEREYTSNAEGHCRDG